MGNYRFSLELCKSARFSEKTSEETAAALYSSGCDDALVTTRCGVPCLEFDREAGSFSDALLSAIRDVEGCAVNGEPAGLRVRRVEPYDLVNEAEAELDG